MTFTGEELEQVTDKMKAFYGKEAKEQEREQCCRDVCQWCNGGEPAIRDVEGPPHWWFHPDSVSLPAGTPLTELFPDGMLVAGGEIKNAKEGE